MTNEQLIKWLRSKQVCPDAIDWVIETDLDARSAWCECQNPVWMLWLAHYIQPGFDMRSAADLACETNTTLSDIVRQLIPWDTVEAFLRNEQCS